MDAAEYEGDIQLQKAASGLLADFDTSLEPFLWRTVESGRLQIRRRVRAREKDRLLRLLAPFQELPQLLDPHLEKFIPTLAEAYLEGLRHPFTSNKPVKDTSFLVPLSTAICELLYTFCKIRGEKVILRFLNAETRNLELLLSAIENAETKVDAGASELESSSSPLPWTWEERYICLLWLSHLLLAPFDLATISSSGPTENEMVEIPGLKWPVSLSGVTIRAVPLAIKYLASAGKERDAAKALLVRISMRKDMQELGLLHALIQWALSHLQSSAHATANSTYYSFGILSYLGGLLVSSAATSDMNPYLTSIFRTVQAISEEETATSKSIRSSALARKTVIKVMRSITVIALHRKSSLSKQDMETTEIVEFAIGHLLEALADNDTPVRLAASKALSIITLKLAPAMAMQVVEAVLDALNHNILWVVDTIGEGRGKTRDLSAVNPLEWHGLILTLSHLLYRRSPPPESLSEIFKALLLGLSFERRSTSGSSIGTNVRDAACFGIWALARRYSTDELQNVVIELGDVVMEAKSSSMIQTLATELVVTASLDPAGNIRRGASAALQELIGRHPDIVAEGIAVVQVVDYHAVALRSRAMLEVAPKAALFSKYYEDALIISLRAWRGVGDGDPTSRRNAAAGIGLLATGFQVGEQNIPWTKMTNLMKDIEQQLETLEAREIEQRHGLLMSMAAVISSTSDMIIKEITTLVLIGAPELRETLNQIFQIVLPILKSAKISTNRRIELIAEGVSRIILAVVEVLRLDLVFRTFAPSEVPNIEQSVAASDLSVSGISLSTTDLDSCFERGVFPRKEIVTLAEELLVTWLRRSEQEVVNAATEAASSLMLVVDGQQRSLFVEKWIPEVLETGKRLPAGFTLALTTVFPIVDIQQQEEICQAILQRWENIFNIGSKVIVLQSLAQGSILDSQSLRFVNLIADGLDDYTTDGRGDIGSLVRVEALRATRRVFARIPPHSGQVGNDRQESWFGQFGSFSTLYGKVLRLSAEKLDRVRIEAQQTLAKVCRNRVERERFEHFTISSFDYFRWLLDLQVHDWLSIPFFQYEPNQWRLELFEGLVSSADTGSEDLIRCSRAALADFCGSKSCKDTILPVETDPNDLVCESLFEVARRNISNDRVLVPTLEVLSFLFDMGILQRSKIQWRSLYLLVQKAHYKTGNVRKIEAAIRVYGGLLQVYAEALEKLTTMLLHPFPKIRNQVADTLFVARGVGKGVDWTHATKSDLKRVKEELATQGEK